MLCVVSSCLSFVSKPIYSVQLGLWRSQQTATNAIRIRKIQRRDTIEPVGLEEEDLVIIHKSLDRAMSECQKHVVEEVVEEAALLSRLCE